MTPTETIVRAFSGHRMMIETMLSDSDLIRDIERASSTIADRFRAGGAMLVFGNGGSAADAQHIAGEMVGRFAMERKGLRAIALTTDTSIMTALANDYRFANIFARQIEALGRPGDVAFALSTSGNSPNVLCAIDAARAGGLAVIGLTGKGGGAMRGKCDHLIAIPSDETPRIQEGHSLVYHAICGLVEAELFGG
jgi:D-sedoheptulose 7-phosphate isomerase